MTTLPHLLVIVGPTASGKTKLAVQLAKKLNGEIVSADSRQVYRGLDIGSGKDRASYGKVPVHMLDVASPKRTFTVSLYQSLATAAIADIVGRGKLPIMVGGSGLYVDSVTKGLVLPQSKPDQKLRKKLASKSLPQLLALLKKLDSDAFDAIDRKNRRRVERAIETLVHTGQPLSASRQSKPVPYQVETIGISVPVDELKRRIIKRLKSRLNKGLVEEVKRLKRQGISDKRLMNLGLEYSWVNRYIIGELSKRELMDGLTHAICQFAKRQMTWFKRDKRIKWIQKSHDLGRSFFELSTEQKPTWQGN
jgi:tRNA dimethylallyltransferase